MSFIHLPEDKQQPEPDSGNDTLYSLFFAVGIAVIVILLAAIASLFPESLFTKIFIYVFGGFFLVLALFRKIITRAVLRRMK